MEETEKNPEITQQPVAERPFLLTVFCLFSFVFYGFISLLFLLGIFFSGWFTEMLNKYTPENTTSRGMLLLFMLGGFIFHAASVSGSVLMWLMNRKGYFIFSISGLILAGYQLFQSRISFITTSVYIAMVVLFGLFYKRLR